MRAMLAGAAVALLTFGPAIAASKLTPKEIQTEFFDGKTFTAATTSGVKFKMTFTVDGTIKFVGKGLSTKSREKGGKITAVDATGEGDAVSVTYHDMGGTMHAAQVRINNKAMATKK